MQSEKPKSLTANANALSSELHLIQWIKSAVMSLIWKSIHLISKRVLHVLGVVLVELDEMGQFLSIYLRFHPLVSV